MPTVGEIFDFYYVSWTMDQTLMTCFYLITISSTFYKWLSQQFSKIFYLNYFSMLELGISYWTLTLLFVNENYLVKKPFGKSEHTSDKKNRYISVISFLYTYQTFTVNPFMNNKYKYIYRFALLLIIIRIKLF